MYSRLFTTQSSNEKRGGDTRNEYKQDYKKIMQQFSVLDVALWPTELPPRFGEDEVKELCIRFNLQSRLILNAFRDMLMILVVKCLMTYSHLLTAQRLFRAALLNVSEVLVI